jgi:hypothetical protein
VGLQPTGARVDLLYDLSRPSVLVTLSGPELTVDSVDPAQLHATIAVGALDVGSHTEMVTVVPPPNLIVVAVIPNPVDIVIRVAPRSSPSPTSGESPPGSPPTSSPGP